MEHKTISAISISREIVENILYNELCMTKVFSRWMSRLLTLDYNDTRVIISQQNLTLFEADPT